MSSGYTCMDDATHASSPCENRTDRPTTFVPGPPLSQFHRRNAVAQCARRTSHRNPRNCVGSGRHASCLVFLRPREERLSPPQPLRADDSFLWPRDRAGVAFEPALRAAEEERAHRFDNGRGDLMTAVERAERDVEPALREEVLGPLALRERKHRISAPVRDEDRGA